VGTNYNKTKNYGGDDHDNNENENSCDHGDDYDIDDEDDIFDGIDYDNNDNEEIIRISVRKRYNCALLRHFRNDVYLSYRNNGPKKC